MSEIKGPVGFDNRVYTQNISQVKKVKTSGYVHTGAKISCANNADCYVSSVSKGAKTKTSSLLDNCLAYIAPKLYLDKYLNPKTIKEAINSNPRIEEILSENGLGEIYMENIQGINREHFLTTYQKAKELASCLQEEDDATLIKAALLHDIGKVFIPPEILNKPAKLTKEEREIVDLHSKLGAEILRGLGFDYKVCDAVRHHHISKGCGCEKRSEVAEILSVADVYSALKEERPYKKQFSDDKVRQIMQNDPKLNTDFVNQIFYSEDLSIA